MLYPLLITLAGIVLASETLQEGESPNLISKGLVSFDVPEVLNRLKRGPLDGRGRAPTRSVFCKRPVAVRNLRAT